MPSLLIDGIGNSLDTTFSDLTEDMMNDMSCYRLQAASEQESISIYIERDSMLIRRIREEAVIDPAIVFDAETYAKVSRDLSEAGANSSSVLSKFTTISEIVYEKVLLNDQIANDVFAGPASIGG